MELYLNLSIDTFAKNKVVYLDANVVTWVYNNRPVDQEKLSRSLLHNVNLDLVDAAISFVHKNNNHWILVFLDAQKVSEFYMYKSFSVMVMGEGGLSTFFYKKKHGLVM